VAKIPKLGRVTERAPNGDWVKVEWIDDEGYRTVGNYVLVAWTQPPRAVAERAMQLRRRRAATTNTGNDTGTENEE
jgi:hypothetical protein